MRFFRSLNIAVALSMIALLIVPLIAGAASYADRGGNGRGDDHASNVQTADRNGANANDDRGQGDDESHGRGQLHVTDDAGHTVNLRHIPLTGTLDGGGTFAGSFHLDRFEIQNNRLVAVGDVSGVLKGADGHPQQVTQSNVALPVDLNDTSMQASDATLLGFLSPSAEAAVCGILDLIIRPIDLNLLGLTVHLDTVHLIINAVSGPGNLLGNLLCAVTNLLNPGTPPTLAQLQNITSALNNLVAALGL